MKTILYAEDDANDIALIRMALRGQRGIDMRFVRGWHKLPDASALD